MNDVPAERPKTRSAWKLMALLGGAVAIAVVGATWLAMRIPLAFPGDGGSAVGIENRCSAGRDVFTWATRPSHPIDPASDWARSATVLTVGLPSHAYLVHPPDETVDELLVYVGTRRAGPSVSFVATVNRTASDPPSYVVEGGCEPGTACVLDGRIIRCGSDR